MADSAPIWFAYCPRCAAPMHTVPVMDKPRRVCSACGYVHFTDPKVGVGVAIVESNRLLLVRRAMNPERGKWSLPAGYLDHGEDPRAAAEREAREETGLIVEVGELLDMIFNPPDGGGASIFILYRARCIGGMLQAGDDADAADYFALNQLPELAFASTRAAVDSILRS